MKYYIIGAIALIIIFVFGGIYLGKSSSKESQLTSINISKPWAEVINSNLTNIPADGAQIKALQTGDEVSAGQVKTDSQGLGNIYLSDGSIARLDSSTELTVEKEQYDSNSQKANVGIKLSLGRVWLKIFGLATSDSTWQVKTSNTVATVRGTAFGVEYKNGQTLIVGSKGKVDITVFDPKTGEVVKESAVIITPDTMVTIKDSDISAIKSGKIILTAEPISPDIANEKWIKRAKDADLKIDVTLDQIRVEDFTNTNLREEFKKQIKTTIIETTKTESTKDNTTQTNIQKTNSNSTNNSTSQTGTSGSSAKTMNTVYPVSLSVTSKNSLAKVIEGDTVSFEVIATMSDGTKKNVTTSSTWQIVGKIGSISRDGVFSAKLDISVAELGQSAGSIIATWKDSTSGKTVFNNTPVFTVYASIQPTGDQTGQ